MTKLYGDTSTQSATILPNTELLHISLHEAILHCAKRHPVHRSSRIYRGASGFSFGSSIGAEESLADCVLFILIAFR